ncbi:MAG: hypothetical protein ACREEM_45095 [Blastocatellia bacterium]
MKAPIPNSSIEQPNVRKTSGAERPAQNSKRLLLISDAPERMQTLESAFSLGEPGEVEMTKASSAEELARSCAGRHDLAVVDVAPQRLARILQTLRESDGHNRIPVLVERSRLPHDHVPESLLPAYRAMPCSFEEMKKLARHNLVPVEPRRRRQIL